MTKNVKISAALLLLFAGVLAAIALVSSGGGAQKDEERSQRPSTSDQTSPPATGAAKAVRVSDQRRLGPKGSTGVTFTEFLDFECESCAAAYPVIEELRRKYQGRVTFNLRYFPLDAHANARNAAHAVEAAHQQGELEAMYKRMYETQTAWGEQRDSKADAFRGFAKDLGLNLKTYDIDVADPVTEARVQEDVDAGTTLGVTGTPTFFIDEQRIEPKSVEDLHRLLDEAIARAGQ